MYRELLEKEFTLNELRLIAMYNNYDKELYYGKLKLKFKYVEEEYIDEVNKLATRGVLKFRTLEQLGKRLKEINKSLYEGKVEKVTKVYIFLVTFIMLSPTIYIHLDFLISDNSFLNKSDKPSYIFITLLSLLPLWAWTKVIPHLREWFDKMFLHKEVEYEKNNEKHFYKNVIEILRDRIDEE